MTRFFRTTQTLALAALAALPTLTCCALRPSAARTDQPIIMIKSVRLPERSWLPWYTRWAEHLWIDFRYGKTWHRMEWDDINHIRTFEIDTGRAFSDERWERDVAVHESYSGAWAEQVAARILTVGPEYPCVAGYRPWPGPNSNSFIEWLAAELGLPVVLPPTAIGKDFPSWFHAGVTSSRTGLEVETIPIGFQVGLREGVELHLLGLTMGVGVWPPSLKVPFLPAIPGGWFAPW